MITAQSYLIGIDGGGTSCRCRLTDTEGNLLAETKTGSANVFQNPALAWESVSRAIDEALTAAQLPLATRQYCSVVAGLAGAEVHTAADQFMSYVSGFANFDLLNDAQIACLGAHVGQDGAVFIIGTGTIGIAYKKKNWRRVGGWGFPLDDIGSGAWLGQQAIRAALYVRDHRETESLLSNKVWQHFSHDSDQLIDWSLSAKSGDYGKFAPLVLEAFAEQDAQAQRIISKQLRSIEQQVNALLPQNLPLCLMGGLAPWVENKLPEYIQRTLVQSRGDALDGALAFAAKRIKQ